MDDARIPFQRSLRPEEPAESQMSWQQLDGERLSQDPDWPASACWALSYVKMHNMLLQEARQIQSEGQQAQEEQHGRTGLEAVTIASSLKLLKNEVFSLCPMHFLISGIVVSFVLTTLSFMVPWVQGQLVDVAVSEAAKYAKDGPEAVDIGAALFEPILLLSVLMFSSYLCEIMVGILFAICGHTTVTRLRIKLFQNLTEQEIAFYDSHVSGELSSRLINDSQALSSLTQFTTQTVLGAVVKFAGSLLAMFATHPKLALLATIITPINMVLVKRTGKTVGFYGVVQNHAMAKANAVAVEVLGSVRTVQSNVGEQYEAEFFMHRLNRYLRIIKATVYLETVLRFTQYGLSKVRNIVVLAVAMNQVITGQLTIGSYTAFAQYVTLYEDGFKNLADIWINFKQTITSTGKFIQLLLRQPDFAFDQGLQPTNCLGRLHLKDVSFAYASRPDHQVLSSINLEANPGDVVALVGESGAGKSTLGRLLLRHYDPTSGHIFFDALDYRSLNLRWLRAQIGFVEQEPVLFDRTLEENIAYGSAKGAPMKDIQEAASRANAHNFISTLQNGYNTHPGERAARISGGQKQRVAIARAIIRNPKLLVLDEATSALDSENEHIVQQALDELMNGRTTFVIAHRLSTVIGATKIMVLDKGYVIEEGSHSELVARENSRYGSFMKHQLVSPLLS
ncbi:ABC transporter B family member 1 (ABC transporter ABCB.1) [Durusdinium trenchii]|uniref:ABC transporter B family member 1 (ABC transporter ABCB.1) n=1 Tax=Durusdinium trenchii TaxID=1381693 RepID=A0ABP0QNE0_9DINO